MRTVITRWITAGEILDLIKKKYDFDGREEVTIRVYCTDMVLTEATLTREVISITKREEYESHARSEG